MNNVISVDVTDSDCRLMSDLLTRAGYEPVIAEDMEAVKHVTGCSNCLGNSLS